MKRVFCDSSNWNTKYRGAALMQQTSHVSHLGETELAVTICGENDSQ